MKQVICVAVEIIMLNMSYTPSEYFLATSYFNGIHKCNYSQVYLWPYDGPVIFKSLYAFNTVIMWDYVFECHPLFV